MAIIDCQELIREAANPYGDTKYMGTSTIIIKC